MRTQCVARRRESGRRYRTGHALSESAAWRPGRRGMNALQRDQAIGRRLARNGMRITRSDRQPYPFERLASYRAASACVPVDAFCNVW